MIDKNVFKKLSYGLYIITSSNEKEKAGCVVNTVTQITSNNPILAISINKDNYTNKIIKESKKLIINILSEKVKKDVITTFGFYSSKDIDKFANVDYELFEGIPALNEGINGYIVGEVISITSVFTHDIFLVKVISTKVINNDDSLTYKYYQENMKGTSPKKAPTFIEEEIKSAKPIYRCTICGHIYDDSKESIPFASLPDDWKCPVCGVGKDNFERIN